MSGNYVERLRISIDIENQTRKDQINPTISLGLNDEFYSHYTVTNDFDTYSFDAIVYTVGSQIVQLKINELEQDSWRIGQIYIRDLRIHGISVGMNLYNSIYYPVSHPDGHTEMPSTLCLGNRGLWSFQIDTPLHENTKDWKIGLV